MNTKHRFTPVATVLAPLVLALLTQTAQAGRPLQTEDAGVLDRGECEIEVAQANLKVARITARDMGAVLNCGFGLNSEIGVGGSVAKLEGVKARSAAIGGKTSLWRGDPLPGADDDDGGPEITLAWGLFADRENGKYKHSSTDINLVGTLPLGYGAVHANVGQTRTKSPKETARTWGLAFEAEAIKFAGLKWQPMAEVFGQQGEDNWVNLGLRLTVVPKTLFLDASYGQQQTKTDKPKLVTAGLKYVF